jgi:hypothetical protein
MRHPLSLLATIAIGLFASGCSERPDDVPLAPPDPPNYTVTVDSAAPLLLGASLDLTAMPGTGRSASVQGVTFGLTSQVQDVHCDDRPLDADPQGHWQLPDDCCRRLPRTA